MRSTRRSLLIGAFALPVLAATRPTAAQNFPSRPIKIIVPFPPGGGVDLTARLLMEPLSKELGQTVDHREQEAARAASSASRAMSHAPADGYTPGADRRRHADGRTSICARCPTIRWRCRTSRGWCACRFIVAVRNDLPAKTLPEFMELAKKTEIRWASGGIGTSQHLAGELFTQMSRPEDGACALSRHRTGAERPRRRHRRRLLRRSRHARPDQERQGARHGSDLAPRAGRYCPTRRRLAEAVPGYPAENWYAIAAPPKTPEPVMAVLTNAILKVLADPAVKAKYDEAGLHPATIPRPEYVAFLERDSKTWATSSPRATSRLTDRHERPSYVWSSWPSISAERSPTSCLERGDNAHPSRS